MKYINQLDYPDRLYVTRKNLEGEEREKGKFTTVRSSGCGLCAAIMAVDRLLPNSTFDLQVALRLAYDTNSNHQVGTDYKIYAPALAEKLDLTLEVTDDPERLRFCLQTGGAAVVHSRGDRDGYIGVFTHKGHYVTAIGVEPDGRIAILDPSYKPGKFDEEGRQGKVEIKNGELLVCDIQVLVDDADYRVNSFYLFWRK